MTEEYSMYYKITLKLNKVILGMSIMYLNNSGICREKNMKRNGSNCSENFIQITVITS